MVATLPCAYGSVMEGPELCGWFLQPTGLRKPEPRTHVGSWSEGLAWEVPSGVPAMPSMTDLPELQCPEYGITGAIGQIN